MKCPILMLACAFALGILVCRNAGLPVLLAACALCFAGAVLCFCSRRIPTGFVWALALGGFFAGGGGRAWLFQTRFSAKNVSHIAHWGFDLSRPILLDGTIATSPLIAPYGVQFDLQVAEASDGERIHAAEGKVRMRVLNSRRPLVPAGSLHLRYGEAIQVPALLRRPANDHNPGAFDYRRWMESIQDIYWQGTIEGTQGVRHIKGYSPPRSGRLIARARDALEASIERIYPPWSANGRNGAVLKAILLGDRSALDSTTIENFRSSGLYHLLVVAGLHVGLLVLLAGGLLRLIGIRAAWRTGLLLLFLLLYAALVEQRAPTLRASLMIGTYLLARLLGVEQPALNAVGIAALILLVCRPAWLFDSGFQLSFAAALLIAGVAIPLLDLSTEPYRRALRRIDDWDADIGCPPRAAQFRLDLRGFAGWFAGKSRWPADEATRRAVVLGVITVLFRIGVWALDLVIFSAVLQFGLLLPMAEIFHRVTLVGIGLNTLAAPLMTALLAIAVPMVLLGIVTPALAAILSKLLSPIMALLFGLTALPRMPHWLSFRVPAPSFWVAAGFVVFMVAAAFALKSGTKVKAVAGLGAISFGLVIAVCPFGMKFSKGATEITELDCGGGEALLMILPGGHTALVGSGGGSRRWLDGADPLLGQRWDPGENVVSPYLWSRRIKTLDALIIPDMAGNHLSGVPALLKNFRVKEFWYGSLPAEPAKSELVALLHDRAVTMRRLRSGDNVDFYGTRFQVFSPSDAAESGGELLLRVSSGDGSVLLAADLTRAAQAAVEREHFPLRSGILQASASEINEGFAEQARPQIALIDAAGQGARLLPDRLRSQSMQILNAAARGAVMVRMSRGRFVIQSYLDKNRDFAAR